MTKVLTIGDIRDLLVRFTELPPAERENAEWVMSRSTFDQLTVLANGPSSFPGLRPYLLGTPVRIEEGAENVELRVIR